MRHIGDVTRGMGSPEERGRTDPYAGGIITKHGWFSYEEVGEHGGVLRTDDRGNRVVQFPEFGQYYRPIPEHKLDEGER